jgi:D-alanyl-D-alanine carboxypeptidase
MPNLKLPLAAAALVLASLAAAPAPAAAPRAAADKALTAKLQRVLSDYLQNRAQPESISGAALRIDRGASTPPIELYAGTDGLNPPRPLGRAVLFQIGSNTKHFTAALILKLEVLGKLSINDPIGKYLPQYPAWKAVTIKSLLNMTSDLPNYSEVPKIGAQMAADIHHQFSNADLIAAVYPGANLPAHTGWFYSNTNNILAALIIEAVTHTSYKSALQTYLFKPLHLNDTFYADGAYPATVLARVPRGLYENHECLLYQPTPCTKSTLAPLIGQDVRTQNMSWAGAAGAIISSPRDLATWIRAVFSLRVFPKAQLDEMTAVVSQATGKPIADVSPTDPRGFSLDLGRVYDQQAQTKFWFYEGITLGYRSFFTYWPQYDLLITAATNSQPQQGRDQFGPLVMTPAFDALRAAK